ncbi:MAG TPA: ABC transporter permease [Gammaproteobacteria bacterium]|jgi:putative ABC transport system permease protein|nr:ABC transporter permease [Gammaproteobacteria bacterium]HJP42378.1 ABC transporter permease [Gammaproteobacteria bacterium]|tara:strand:- start:164 stop:1312 length:1149 start_codon:yes stop_codon:yes gene_type:complete
MLLIATSIGVMAVILLTAVGEGARDYITGEFKDMGTNLLIVLPGKNETTGGGSPVDLAGVAPRDLTVEDAISLRQIEAINRIAPIVVGETPAQFNGLERSVPIIGTTPSFLAVRQWEMESGNFLPGVTLDRSPPVCVIGKEVESELFGKNNALGQWLRVGDRRCRVTGIIGTEGRAIGIDVQKIVVMPVSLATALFNRPSLFRIIAEARNSWEMDHIKKEIIRIIKKRHQGKEDITVIRQDAVMKSFDNIFNVLTMALGSIASISLFVAGILIMNVMLVAVSQRQSEIGLLKAIGAKNKQINYLFITEAIILSGSGAILGLILGHTTTQVLKLAFPTFNFLPPLWASFVSLIVALLSGIIFGLLPARRASKLDPVIALSGNK